MEPENKVIPVENSTPDAVLAFVGLNVGRVANANACNSWYWVAVFQSCLILSLFPFSAWAPIAPEGSV